MPRPRYQSKTIAICTNACAASKRLRGKSYLVHETPSLPLPNCDRTCYCKFTNHDDRRIKDDRRFPAEEIDQLEGLESEEDVRGVVIGGVKRLSPTAAFIDLAGYSRKFLV